MMAMRCGDTIFPAAQESYGGKMTVGFATVLLAAIAAGEIKMNFKGVALGDSWCVRVPLQRGISSLRYAQFGHPMSTCACSVLTRRIPLLRPLNLTAPPSGSPPWTSLTRGRPSCAPSAC